MNYFKIFSKGKGLWWSQDGLGYTDEDEAGFWPESMLAEMGLDECQLAIPFSPAASDVALIAREQFRFGDLSAADGYSRGESERIELRCERDERWARELDNVETETIIAYQPAWMNQLPHE